jgi:hydrogenase large subunit
MAYGDFATDVNDDSSVLFPRGRVMGRDLGKVEPVDQQEIAEAIVHSWYEYERDGNAAKHPWEGETRPKYGGPNPPFESLEGYAKYSWLKAPRYDGQAMEVGPLARMLVGYASGKREIRDAIDGALGNLGVAADRLFSTMGRIAARALECQVLLPALDGWARQLRSNLESGRLQVADSSKWNPESWPAQAQGFGWEEAPRGALGHWVVIENKAIKNYQLVVPSTWNGSPRDGDDRRAREEALLDTPLADADQPLKSFGRYTLRPVHGLRRTRL